MKTENRYKIVSGPDGTLWVPLQPLLHDIIDQSQAHVDNAEITSQLNTVRAFISALIVEGKDTTGATVQ